MDTTTQARIHTWLNGNYADTTKSAIRNMSEAEQNEAFYKDLAFGTGGMRGLLGVGTNRINRYTVGSATQGLANYLKKHYEAATPLRAAIAYDNRHQSDTLAQVVADVFSANDIEVFLFDRLRPTPELSFAIRHLDCHTGVVLTASHNPKDYNGYKAYWRDGGQVVPPHDKGIMAEVQAITSVDAVRFNPKPEKIKIIGKEVDEAYLDYLQSLSVSPETIRQHHDIPLVFSPLHGTGIVSVPPALERFGFTNVHLVTEQSTPDGDFPTVVYPNPEEAEAMKMGLEYAEKYNAEVLMATDPDGDRVGIAVRDQTGDFRLLNGNQTGALLVAYMLEAWQRAGKLDGRQMVVKTIVTTDLIADIAAHFGVNAYETLTGFKYIAEVIRRKEGQETFIVGGEESYGYLIGDGVRDKDAVAACALIAEMAAHAKAQGQTLFERLLDLYRTYGCYQEGLFSLVKEGKSGAEAIQAMMKDFRQTPPVTIGNDPVAQVLDYQSLRTRNPKTGEESPLTGFPKADVLQFVMESGAKLSVRPSGTEPKIKFYVSVKAPLKASYAATQEQLQAQIAAYKKDLVG